MPSGSCMSICITSHPSVWDLAERKYHNVLFCVKPFIKMFLLLFRDLFRQQGGKYFAASANLHLFPPAQLYLTFTDGAVYEPAKIAGLEFPGRALLPLLRGTFFDHPAGFAVFTALIHSRDQKIHLSFHIGWYGSPGLLVTVDRFDRYSEQLSHLLLGFVYLLAKMDELFAVHREFRKPVARAVIQYDFKLPQCGTHVNGKDPLKIDPGNRGINLSRGPN